MTHQFDGKVAFITGAARGQGRAHAVRFAEEGADIIAVDLCEQIDSVSYPMATPEDLDETVNLVEKTGRRIVAEHGDVRDFERLQGIVAHGVAELGRLDFVLANAGVLPAMGEHRGEVAAFVDAVDVMLKGVHFTIEAALPAMLAHGDGGTIVITSSAAGFKSVSPGVDTMSHGAAGYNASKHGVVGLMRYYATSLAERNIRVNSVHPGGVATPMILNDAVAGFLTDHPKFGESQIPLLPDGLVTPEAVSDAMVYLCGASGRYLTGVALPVDAGLAVK
ncbi:mycofactocin-coupled SDR family oxidoreductase [Mycolicibacterium celeriflavum]|uniref:3-ketoacyl-ACP reductase n=1 Tax=Mycolicibacterium celeriflavum TaxID=1249101 RepID=A0A1X0C2U0_MYCCF|nr:mycofactocin-coupled SDR family oxidoreductase [Mycolicibacterium celeriflavum]MCV7239496.1 mycofactocin-coupled SDR family oxidoreductase [Mycolicibacterium celeriflavum]ORA51664.1 3-ketoacyl-ACP reductase [Mycolicibacterium celeriflavum]BBY43186.1 3-ketoacyl-ACP reductase [Mycolicibacterium celeriflavum]